MTPLRTRMLGVVLVFWCLWISAGDPAIAQRAARPLLVVMGASTGIVDIDLGKLRSAFQSQPTRLRGMRLVPFNAPVGNPARQLFDKSVLGLEPTRVGSFWVDQRVRYSLFPPRSIASAETILRVVASMPGAIGYVQMNPAHVPLGVRVLRVDGESPADDEYPFH